MTGYEVGVSDRGAVQEMSRFAAVEFERISALAQTLLELMKQPRFYASPTLAAAQLTTISEIAELASVTVDQMAAGLGFERLDTEQGAIFEAHRTFLERHPKHT
ncbi:MAG: hypothetical protein EOP39_23595 [Rubrivivax sp.]|nr:MAG: hypothetical protein EOP39_23595 [Rubrivivax sp.]